MQGWVEQDIRAGSSPVAVSIRFRFRALGPHTSTRIQRLQKVSFRKSSLSIQRLLVVGYYKGTMWVVYEYYKASKDYY